MISKKIDDKLVILDLEREKIYFLNKTAEAVWHIFSTKKTITQAVKELLKKYKVSKPTAIKDIETIIDKYQNILFFSSRK